MGCSASVSEDPYRAVSTQVGSITMVPKNTSHSNVTAAQLSAIHRRNTQCSTERILADMVCIFLFDICNLSATN